MHDTLLANCRFVLTDLVADRSQRVREGRPAEDAAKLPAIIVNDTDVFDALVVNLPFAPLEIKPVIDGKFFPSLVYDFGADIERPISSSKLQYKLHAKFCTIGFCPSLINERLDAIETLEKRFY